MTMTVRDQLIEKMAQLENRQISCAGCPGHCCTYKHNSMMITQVEARTIVDYLKQTSDLATVEKKLQNCVEEFRLNYDLPGIGKKPLRRTYTCPFFKGEALGCSLPFDIKPIGCLAFNPVAGGVQGVDCRSDFEGINTDEIPQVAKAPIPVAILNLFGIERE